MKNCPVATAVSGKSFTEAVEDFSLAAIMSKMTEEYQMKQDEKDGSHEGIEKARDFVLEGVIAAKTKASLSETFKNGTASAHQAAENVHFVANFIRGNIDRRLYAILVSQLLHVYTVLEDRLEECASFPMLENFAKYHKALQRKDALEEDVDFWGREEVFQETKEYADRLRTLDPLLLLAHSYTRYLGKFLHRFYVRFLYNCTGDLSGGKILQRAAKRAMDLQTDGLAFYNFEYIPSAKRFKDEFRAEMDSLSLNNEDVDRLVREANIAFLLNMRIFEVLDVKANFPGATVRSLAEVLAFQPAKTESNECPFAKAQGNTTKGRCPWPFILLHDPIASLHDWQTWGLFGLVLAVLWSYLK